MKPEVNLMIVSRQRRENECIIPEESHPWHEFVYYISCEGRLKLDGELYDIKPGRFVTIPPKILHSELHTADGIVFFCIFRSDARFESAVFDDDSDRTILRLCESIYSERKRSGSRSAELQTLMMQELLLRVDRWTESRLSVRHDLDWAADCIRLNFREQLSMANLAADIGYGYDYFQHCFKEKFGRSPKQFQIDCRINEAKSLLESGGYSCTEIAYLCGFSNSAQFSSIFKKSCGCPPGSWRGSGCAKQPEN